MVKVRLYYIPITFQSGTLVLTKEFGAMTNVIATMDGDGWESPPLRLKAHHYPAIPMLYQCLCPGVLSQNWPRPNCHGD